HAGSARSHQLDSVKNGNAGRVRSTFAPTADEFASCVGEERPPAAMCVPCECGGAVACACAPVGRVNGGARYAQVSGATRLPDEPFGYTVVHRALGAWPCAHESQTSGADIGFARNVPVTVKGWPCVRVCPAAPPPVATPPPVASPPP